jgi:hypothetical protein
MGQETRRLMNARDLPNIGIGHIGFDEALPDGNLHNCVMAERYWDPVRWAIQQYRWRFEELAPSRRIERGDGADPSVATMARSRDPAR